MPGYYTAGTGHSKVAESTKVTTDVHKDKKAKLTLSKMMMTKVAFCDAVAKGEALYCKREVATSRTWVVTQTANARLIVVGIPGLLFSPTRAIINGNLEDDITEVSGINLLKLGHAYD